MFYLTMHSTHFIYGYMASDIWLRTILIVREETRCRHIGYSFQLAARVLLYAPSHRQDSTYHGLCYTSHGALAGTRNSSMGNSKNPMKDRPDHPSHHEQTLLPPSLLFPFSILQPFTMKCELVQTAVRSVCKSVNEQQHLYVFVGGCDCLWSVTYQSSTNYYKFWNE